MGAIDDLRIAHAAGVTVTVEDESLLLAASVEPPFEEPCLARLVPVTPRIEALGDGPTENMHSSAGEGGLAGHAQPEHAPRCEEAAPVRGQDQPHDSGRWRTQGWRSLQQEPRHPLEIARDRLDDAVPMPASENLHRTCRPRCKKDWASRPDTKLRPR